ncbi:hypothetical protein [Nonomuraea africana]|uniref:Uncharacterized protein n=1 Tax=Nonomuraea africana TaxID=46171 RepID=A0ABR9KEH9_9ACTN|nr:hypothetical protein [Nonomuraea africana]
MTEQRETGVETVGVALAGPEQVSEAADERGKLDHLGAGGGEVVQQASVPVIEVVGPREQEPGKAAESPAKRPSRTARTASRLKRSSTSTAWLDGLPYGPSPNKRSK